MLPVRPALVLAPLLGVALATTGHAAPTTTPQVTDAKGDAVSQQAGNDLVSVLYTTEGTGKGKGYVAKKLVVTLELAGPVPTESLYTFEVEASTDQCGDVMMSAQPGTPYGDVTGLNGWVDWGDCATTDGGDLLTAKVSGNKVVWQFSLKGTPLKLGALFTDFRARVDPSSNPAVPFPSQTFGTELGLLDSATATGTWKLG